MSHEAYMQRALAQAHTHLGQTWPNPSVGAVIVKNNRIIGEGCTARGGRPHAETQALAQCIEPPGGADMYVSLEPCSHLGQTPPCTDAIIRAGIKRCIVACRDPHPQHGGGIEKLKTAGIEVIEGILENEARELNRGFFSVVEKGRPFVALKIASSADGKIAGGPTRWITGEESRQYVHKLRSEFDAILTGIGTVLADDPLLNVRAPGLEHKSPVRVILDRHHRLPDDSEIAKTQEQFPTWILDQPDVAAAIQYLSAKGITRVLVEAGQKINSAFMESGLVDRIYWFKAPQTIGEKGLNAFAGPVFRLADWEKPSETRRFGNDQLEIYERRAR